MITGSATEDQTLTADTAASPTPTASAPSAYQWLRDGMRDHRRHRHRRYLLGDADVGPRISVRVVLDRRPRHARESLTSAPTAPVANVNDAPTGAPTISRQRDRGPDADRRHRGDRRRRRPGHLRLPVAARRRARSPAPPDRQLPARRRRCRPAHQRAGRARPTPTARPRALTSAPTAPVANVNDAPTGAPVITGSATEDQTLTADTAAIADADGLGAFGYQWLRDGSRRSPAPPPAPTCSAMPTSARAISVRVSYTDGHGTPRALTSARDRRRWPTSTTRRPARR